MDCSSKCFLYYHRIGSRYRGARNISVSAENFEAQIEFISQNYKVARFEDDFTECNEKTVIIGFDDGYRDVYDIAFPILKKYKVPATVFMVSGGISGKELWNDRLERIWLGRGRELLDEYYQMHELMRSHFCPKELERLLSLQEELLEINIIDKDTNRLLNENELRELADSSLITIGGHTMSHSDLSFLPEDEQHREICEDKKRIESIIGEEINLFSYPFGGVGKITSEILKKAGYKKARCSERGIINLRTDDYFVPGNSVANVDVSEFESFINRIWEGERH